MNNVHDGIWTDHSESARVVLLQYVPLGTNTTNALAALSKEGFGCGDDSFRSLKAHANCQLLAPEGLGYRRWIVDLQFDETSHLIAAKVAIWNIFL